MTTSTAPRSRYASLGASPLVATLASAALFYLGTGLQPFWPATWLAPLPLLWLAFRAPRRGLFWLGTLAFLLGGLNLAPYLLRMAPLPAVLVVMSLPAVVFGLALHWAGRAAEAGRTWLAVLALPVAWVSYELVLSSLSPHGTFGSLAYSQADFLPLLQVASLAGLSGMVFVLLLAPSTLAWLLARPAESRAPALAGLALVAVALGFGGFRLATSGEGEPLKVGLLADDSRVPAFETEEREEALEVIESYARRAGELAAAGARVVVLPEKVVGVAPAYEDELVARLRALAKSANVTLVAGLNLLGREPKRNQALVLAADGSTLASYEKAFPVPGWERGYAQGDEPGLFRSGDSPAGVAICKDLDFPRWLARYAGAKVVFVPAWDFGADGWLHARMAVFRGVEQGFSLVRSANEGLATASDAYGRVPAEGRGGGGPVAVSAQVRPGPGTTVYGRVGDAFGWVVVGFFVLAVVASLRR